MSGLTDAVSKGLHAFRPQRRRLPPRPPKTGLDCKSDGAVRHPVPCARESPPPIHTLNISLDQSTQHRQIATSATNTIVALRRSHKQSLLPSPVMNLPVDYGHIPLPVPTATLIWRLKPFIWCFSMQHSAGSFADIVMLTLAKEYCSSLPSPSPSYGVLCCRSLCTTVPYRKKRFI